MPEVVKLSKTARDRILEPYEEASQEYEFRTTPISSSAQFVGEVVNPDAANGIAYVVFRPQKVKYFRHGDGDKIAYGAIDNSEVTEAESNLQKGGSTDGARDMAIEGISFDSQGVLCQYFAHEAAIAGLASIPTDVNVVAALRGEVEICDPFGLLIPPQLQSPYLLEDAAFQAIKKQCTITLTLDTSRPFRLGGADLCPGSAGSSMLRASGSPEAGNLYRIHEGILWKRDGRSDSDLKVEVELQRPVVMPISLVTPPGAAQRLVPTRVYIRAMMRIHGVSVSELPEN